MDNPIMFSTSSTRKQLNDLLLYLSTRLEEDAPIIIVNEPVVMIEISDERKRVQELIEKRRVEELRMNKPMRAYIEEEIQEYMPHRRI